MGLTASQTESPTSKSRLVFFTNTFPFAPGEEFIEGEIPFLSGAFDEVLVIPCFPYLRQGHKRELPANFRLLTPQGLDGSRKNYGKIIKFALRRPQDIVGAVRNAVRAFPRFHSVLEDFKLELFARMIVQSVITEASEHLSGATRVVFYSYWMYAPARVAVQLRRRLGKDESLAISRAHGYDVFSERKVRNYLPQRELLFENLTRVHPVSDHGTAYLHAKYPRFSNKVTTRRLGVVPSEAPGRSSQDPFVVYSCAYLHPVKRIPLLIQALAEAQSQGLKLQWIHIGSSADGAMVQEMVDLAKSALAEGSFEFVGNRSNSEVREQYLRQPGTVFVNTSASEGVPVSIMEALAEGMPVIATDVGGNSELIAPELGMFDGLLSPDPTPAEVAEKLRELFAATPGKYHTFVEGSLRTWSSRWSNETNYSRFVAELAEVE